MLVLSKAETMKFDGSLKQGWKSRRLGAPDFCGEATRRRTWLNLLKSDIWWIVYFFPAHTAGISSTTVKQHKSWLAWIRCRLHIRFAENYSSHLFTHYQKQNLWVAIGSREKPHPLVLNKAGTIKFDGSSSRVRKVVDWVLQTCVGRPQERWTSIESA